jgi:hypothetical protein
VGFVIRVCVCGSLVVEGWLGFFVFVGCFVFAFLLGDSFVYCQCT